MGLEALKSIGRMYTDSRRTASLNAMNWKLSRGLRGKKGGSVEEPGASSLWTEEQEETDSDREEEREPSGGASKEASDEGKRKPSRAGQSQKEKNAELGGEKEQAAVPGPGGKLTLHQAVIWSEILGPPVGKKNREKRMERLHGDRSYAGRR